MYFRCQWLQLPENALSYGSAAALCPASKPAPLCGAAVGTLGFQLKAVTDYEEGHFLGQ